VSNNVFRSPGADVEAVWRAAAGAENCSSSSPVTRSFSFEAREPAALPAARRAPAERLPMRHPERDPTDRLGPARTTYTPGRRSRSASRDSEDRL
jgi:hypothetical protein